FGATSLASVIPASALKEPVPRERYPEFFRHFDAFLPTDVRAGERTLALVDHLSSGRAVEHLAIVLEAYLRGRGVARTVVRSGFHAHAAPPDGFDSLPAAGLVRALPSDGGGVAEFDHRVIGERGGSL